MVLYQRLLISVVCLDYWYVKRYKLMFLTTRSNDFGRSCLGVSPIFLPLELKYSMPFQSLLKYVDIVNILVILFSLIGSREKKKHLIRNLHNAGTRNRLVRGTCIFNYYFD